MLSWEYGANPLPQWNIGSITLIEQPWWLHFLEWFADHSCSFIPPIPFPDMFKRQWDKDDEEKTEYTMREWFGDLRSAWCHSVAISLLNWILRHPKRKTYEFNVGYDKLREVMFEHGKEDFERWDKNKEEYIQEEKERQENIRR